MICLDLVEDREAADMVAPEDLEEDREALVEDREALVEDLVALVEDLVALAEDLVALAEDRPCARRIRLARLITAGDTALTVIGAITDMVPDARGAFTFFCSL